MQTINIDDPTVLLFNKEIKDSEITAQQWSGEENKGKESSSIGYAGMITILKPQHQFIAQTTAHSQVE